MNVVPGMVVFVRIFGVLHEGIVTDRIGPDGMYMVIAKSKKRRAVVEETWTEFAEGLPVWVSALRPRLPVHEVLQRARARQGEPWNAFANCQHFVRECLGLESASPDLKAIGTAAVVSLLAGVGAAALAGGGAPKA